MSININFLTLVSCFVLAMLQPILAGVIQMVKGKEISEVFDKFIGMPLHLIFMTLVVFQLFYLLMSVKVSIVL